MKSLISNLTLGVSVLGFSVLSLAFSSTVRAGTLTDANVPGEVCTPSDPNTTGSGFSCTLDRNNSPLIAAFRFNVATGAQTIQQINTGLFPSLSAGNFTFNITGTANPGTTPVTGSWTYTPGASDPVITNFAVGLSSTVGLSYNLYSNDGGANTSTFTSTTDSNAQFVDIIFFDSPQSVPEPSALLGLGLLGVGGLVSRKRKS